MNWFMMFAPMLLTAGGTEANSATNLFSSDWTVGNLYEVQGFVNVFGHIAVVVISAVGFGIVIFSILKNAISGLYVVNPPFWDKVDDLKKDAVAGTQGLVQDTIGKSNNVAAKKLGGALTTILGYIPNIKALTDFDDSDGQYIDKKQYFVKSIPLLVAQIFIGMLIFLGYPTKIAEWVGNAGTYVIDTVINNVDPVETVQKISDGIIVYSLATDGSTDPFETNVNEFTRDIFRTVQSEYSDMKKTSAQNVALTLENMIMTDFNNDTVRDVLGVAEGYQITHSAIHQTVTPTASAGFSPVGDGNLLVSQGKTGTISYRWFVNGADLNTGSTMESSADWFVLSIVCTPEAISNASSAGLIVFAPFSSTATVDNSTGLIKVPITDLLVSSSSSDGNTTIKGTLGKTVTVDIIGSDGAVTKTAQAQLSSASVMSTEMHPVLFFGSGDKEFVNAMSSATYCRVNLTGTWTKDVKDGTATTTLRIMELRLTPGGSVSWALNTWTDFDSKTAAGVGTLDGSTLKKTSLSGS